MTWTIRDEYGREVQSNECPWLDPTAVWRVFELCGHPEGPEKCCRPEQCPRRKV